MALKTIVFIVVGNGLVPIQCWGTAWTMPAKFQLGLYSASKT